MSKRKRRVVVDGVECRARPFTRTIREALASQFGGPVSPAPLEDLDPLEDDTSKPIKAEAGEA